MPSKSRRLRRKKNNATKKIGGLFGIQHSKLSKNMENPKYRDAYIEKIKSLIKDKKIDPNYLNAVIHDFINTTYYYNIETNRFSTGGHDFSKSVLSPEEDFFTEFAYEWDNWLKDSLKFKLKTITYFREGLFYKESKSLSFFIWGTQLYKKLFPKREGNDQIKTITFEEFENLIKDVEDAHLGSKEKNFVIDTLRSLQGNFRSYPLSSTSTR
jgi:hypothetical protein